MAFRPPLRYAFGWRDQASSDMPSSQISMLQCALYVQSYGHAGLPASAPLHSPDPPFLAAVFVFWLAGLPDAFASQSAISRRL